ncbi:hypothetical protein GCK72_000377 [Caenorhabditis remanei]|uniref:F-box domain-containing protein n=2 Tax=Caenorhabditis remanei TaxID=31234 RepID=A0A6A5HLY1_CAERE|nr:hypothetical protein GCK72_000377 [Caenorhabditis remanei]KAF1768565.1 hypothetical protein GCK72_000377 [Caenorhabditis remanei]
MPSVNSKPFPIQKLPELAFEAAVRQISTRERLGLALTSKKTMNLLLAVKFPKDQVHLIRFGETSEEFYATVEVKNPHNKKQKEPFKFVCRVSKKKGEKVFTKYAVDQCLKTSILQEPGVTSLVRTSKKTQCAYQKIAKLFPARDVTIRFINLKTEDVRQILNAPEFENWQEVGAFGIKPPAIKLIMDKATSERRFRCDNTIKLPPSFHHPKAFDFQVAQYSNAMWVSSTKQLLSIRDVELIGLGQTSLRCRDVGIVLKKMLETDYQMCTHLVLLVAGGFDEEAVMGDTVRFKFTCGEIGMFYVRTKTQTTTKIAEIRVMDRNTINITISSDETEYEEARRVLTNMSNRIRIDNELEGAEPGEKRRLQMEREMANREVHVASRVLIASLGFE